MLRKQVFKTLAGAQKRAAFETAHCDGRWLYSVVRCLEGERDTAEFNILRFSKYTWRLERTTRASRDRISPHEETYETRQDDLGESQDY